MNISLFIAKRYLLAKKSHHVINIISMVSMAGVAVGSLGLIVVLSVFNGFGNLVVSLYDQFDPDIRITLREGKSFDPADARLQELKQVKGVRLVAEVVEENALLKYHDKQFIVRLKGMNNDYAEWSGVKKKILDGAFILERDSIPFAVLGSVVAYSLGINLQDPFYPIQVYVPKKGEEVSLNPMEAFSTAVVHASGVFAIQQDFDSKYVLIPVSLARELTNDSVQVTALEILLDKGADAGPVKDVLASLAGPRFAVKDRMAQHDFLYKILKSEKVAVFLILGLILLIATFSIIGTLTMLVIEKKKDIAVLSSMGAGQQSLTSIFLNQGLMITGIGAFSGLAAGGLICFLQQKFGLIKLENADSFVVDSYPVAMQAGDFLLVLLLVGGIGFLASWYTSTRLVKTQLLDTVKL